MNSNDSSPQDADSDEDLAESYLEQHGDYLFRFAMMRVKNVHIAEEVVQETLLKAIKAKSTFRGEASLKTWLAQILRNEIFNFYRKDSKQKKIKEAKQERQASDLGTLLHPRISNDDFASTVEKQEFWAMIQQCFDKVPEHLLDTFLLRLANQDKKTDELCNELGINASNFSVRMFRTRLLLRKCVETNWYEAE